MKKISDKEVLEMYLEVLKSKHSDTTKNQDWMLLEEKDGFALVCVPSAFRSQKDNGRIIKNISSIYYQFESRNKEFHFRLVKSRYESLDKAEMDFIQFLVKLKENYHFTSELEKYYRRNRLSTVFI